MPSEAHQTITERAEWALFGGQKIDTSKASCIDFGEMLWQRRKNSFVLLDWLVGLTNIEEIREILRFIFC